ncbi:Tenascin-R [Holothuria leucospilota]|uniref:Tenascin-R n=1 Tax=Holothuria leucospilota TaxID=206669 RepID=A0A9Q1BWR6_HOLLE|nr:Tenascin-R [Holothuria leucospilota]
MNSLRHSFSVFLVLILVIAVNCLEGLYYFYQQPEYPRDCKEVYEHCPANNSSGVCTIRPDGYPQPFEVYCNNELSPSGWTVIKRQLDGSLTLTRTWEDYRKGFGFLSSEFYIGNEKLSYLTNQGVYELQIDMMLSNGSNFYIRYNKFRISDEFSQYELVNAEGFSGNSSCVATSCPVTMVHESCTCRTSCSDSVGQPDCRELCVETCVPKGCFINETNSIILEGEAYSDSGCTKRCSCTNGQLICNNNYRCDVNAVCERRSNYHKCYCNSGYSGNGTNCQSICSTNEVWGTCSCQKSCVNPTSCVSCSGEKCYCPNGFYLQRGNCVRQEQCGCYIDGRILQDGGTYVNSGCTRRCTCNSNRLNCDDSYRCSSNAACRVNNNVGQCYCNPGYSGDGITCDWLCGTNEVWGTCSCQKSCANPTSCVSCSGEKCYCPNGFYLQGGNCVRQEQCGCYVDGRILQDGATYVNSGCTRRCTCNNNRLNCDDSYRCSSNAACRVNNNVGQCYCNPGYSGDGITCHWLCGTNEIWGTCSCQKSCANPTSCVSCSGEKCYCPNGFCLQGGNCVRQEQCGCYIDGNILQDGTTYVNSGCTRRCTCTNNRLNCDNNYRCSSTAACSVRNGVRQCYCNSGYVGDGRTCRRYTDCNDVQNAGNTQSGVYSIRPTGWTGSPFDVFCNMTIDGGGWTVFQRRINGATNFYRNWNSYKSGFGNIRQEFWLGNEKLHYLTQQATYEYRLDFVTSSYSSLYGKYSRFRIGNEANKYKVTDLGSRSGSGYSLYNIQNIAFSTYDRDNDGKSSTDCAEGHRSGWWHGGYYYYYYYSYCHYFPEGSRYRYCSYANLNGDYSGSNGKNIFTYYYYYCHLKYTEMKIRRTS